MEKILAKHVESGFSFRPHHRKESKIEKMNDISFGDTSISLDYIRSTWKEWTIVDTDFNLIDPYQIIVALKPAK